MRFLAAARRGFTLVELLVVLAILAILAGILFPVFAAARRSAQTASCLSNFKQATTAALIYTADYDDGLFPTNLRPGEEPDPKSDLVWPQLLSGYAGGFSAFVCPAEPRRTEFGGSFDPSLPPADYAARYYDDALHVDLGYNAYNLAPVVWSGTVWQARPKTSTSIADPSQTLMFVESAAAGGGSYLVAPPCRYQIDHGKWHDSFQPGSPAMVWSDHAPVFTPIVGWDLSANQNPYPKGGAGTRHGDRLNVARVDGSARTRSFEPLLDGCGAQSHWAGAITTLAKDPWYAGG